MAESQNIVPFVQLRVHSTYSLGLGLSTPEEICAEAARLGYFAVALADTEGTYGYLEFQRAAAAHKLKPIYGVSFTLDWPLGFGDGTAFVHHPATLIALDRPGLRNLCEITSIVASRDGGATHARISDFDGRGDGLICLIGDGVTPATDSDEQATLVGVGPDRSGQRNLFAAMRTLFGERAFVIVDLDTGEPARTTYEQWVTPAAEFGLRPVIAPQIRYAGRDKRVLAARPVGADEGDGQMIVAPPKRHAFPSLEEMGRYYRADPEAYGNASMIAALVQPDLLAAMDTAASDAPASFLDSATEDRERFDAAVKSRFDTQFADAAPDARHRYERILATETERIHNAGLAPYFLRFHAVLGRLERAHIHLGPSTGLRLQSLCAFLLGITRFDPYEFDANFYAVFEDDPAQHVLDIQISSAERATAVTLINNLFETADVAYVPSVEHITPVRALRTVAERMQATSKELEETIRIASSHPGVTLKSLCEENRAIGAIYKRSAEVREVITSAAVIEGLPSGFIRTKRSVIVSPHPLRDFLSYTINPETGERFVQATRDVFPVGDIFRIEISTLMALGVRGRLETEENESALAVFRANRHEGGPVFDQIERGQLEGIYLLEAPLTRRLALSYKITGFADLEAFLALMRYRRGDLNFAARVGAFVNTTEPERHADDRINDILAPTRGWMLFDDQLRDIITVLVKIGRAEATQIVNRFSANEPGQLAQLRREFMNLCVEADLPMPDAFHWFNQIMFNAPRTVDRQRILADALLVFEMLVLKHRDPVGFLAAVMNEHKASHAKVAAYMAIAGDDGIALPVDINHSGADFTVESGKIRPALSVIKGLGQPAIRNILRERSLGHFTSGRDFRNRMEGRGLDPGEIEAVLSLSGLPERNGEASPAPPPESSGDTASTPPPGARPARREAGAERAQLRMPLAPKAADGGATRVDNANDRSDLRPASPPKKGGNQDGDFVVLPSISEFYPHPGASPVELTGRVSDLQTFETSSGSAVTLFLLSDSTATVRVFAAPDAIALPERSLTDGDRIVVRGRAGKRDGKKVCNALEVLTV